MAAGDILKKEGSPITFGSAGGETVAMTMTGVVDGAGQQSAQYDLETALGATRTNLFKLRAEFQTDVGATEESGVDVYIKRSDGTQADNSEGLTDSAATEGKQRNCLFVGTAIVDAASSTDKFILAVDELLMSDPAMQMVIINKSGQALSATAANLKITLTPIIYQGQSS